MQQSNKYSNRKFKTSRNVQPRLLVETHYIPPSGDALVSELSGAVSDTKYLNHKFKTFQLRLYFLLLLLLGLSNNAAAQVEKESGYLSLPDKEAWQIQIDDSLINKNSYEYLPLPPGKHTLKASPINNKNWSITSQLHQFDIQAAETLRIDLKLQKYKLSQIHDLHKTNIPVNIQNQFSSKKPSVFKRCLKPGLIVTAIAANWTSFYLKRRADDFYDKYNATSSVSRMNHYYDKSVEFDVYSSIMLGVSATALSTYIYLLLTD